jgi:cytochrome c
MKKLPKTILILMASLSLGLLLVQTLGQASAASAKRAGGEEEESELSGKPSVELLLPVMNPEKGRKLFASKGCVVCHSIHGVGGTDAPKLDWSTMKGPMNPFDFTAKMWLGAPAMIAMQRHELGHQIKFTGQELADIIAFAHDPAEQRKFSKKDIPANIRKLMEHDKD